MPLIGHTHIAEQFMGLAARRRLAHGYLFHGPDGVGKRTCALSLAAYLETGAFTDRPERILMDLKLIAPGAGDRSLGIDAVREVPLFLRSKPFLSPYRTLIVDGAEFLTPEAENALLKISEEPGASSLIFMIATDPDELMPTLQSRLQRVAFAPLGTGVVEEWLAGRGVKKNEAKKIAGAAFGRPGLAWRIARDEQFQNLLACAEEFLKGGPAKQKTIIKSCADDETFDLDKFLEALMIAAAAERRSNPASGFWHAALGLRRENRRFALNAKLQLTALARIVQS